MNKIDALSERRKACRTSVGAGCSVMTFLVKFCPRGDLAQSVRATES